MIVFVGHCPSRDCYRRDVPFLGSRSGVRLKAWIFNMGIPRFDYCLLNASNRYGAKRVTAAEVVKLRKALMGLRKAIGALKVVALGTEAQWACKRAGFDPYLLPHPSGLNRKINDKEWLKGELMACKEWLNGGSQHKLEASEDS